MNSHVMHLRAAGPALSPAEEREWAKRPVPPPTARHGAVVRRKADGQEVRIRASSEALRRLRER